MTELANAHLSDETINEYLDSALEGAAHAAAEAHLAGCSVCAGRRAALAAVFSGLEALPDAPLARDLRPAVMAAVRATSVPWQRPVAATARPAFRLIFAVQSLAALVLLAFAWPFVASLALPVPRLAAGDWSAVLARLAGAWLDPNRAWNSIQPWLVAATQPALPPITLLQPIAAALVLTAAGGLWLVCNAVLLRPRAAMPFRRNS